MELELRTDRYFRALQQISAHPHSTQLADHAKLHLWALYEHVFDGLEDPPRFNPVAILRWKHKTEAQVAARKAWESRQGASVESLSSSTRSRDPFARWTYGLDDIEQYKATKGHVEYFIPPQAPYVLANTEETPPERPISSNDSITEIVPQLRAVSNPSSTNLLKREDTRLSYEPLSRSPSNEPHRHKKVGGY